MKRKLNTLKGKRLVTGDSNLMTKDEICINATPNGVEVKEIGTDGKIKDLTGSGNSNGSSSEEPSEKWVSFYALGEPEHIAHLPTKLGAMIISEVCDMAIGYALVPYSSGNGFACSGGTMNINEINNTRPAPSPYKSKPFNITALKIRDDINTNKFIDRKEGTPQQNYDGGLGRYLEAINTMLLDHGLWTNYPYQERVILTMFAYGVIVMMSGVDEQEFLSYTSFKKLFEDTLDMLGLSSINDLESAIQLTYLNKQEELNRVLDIVNNYEG